MIGIHQSADAHSMCGAYAVHTSTVVGPPAGVWCYLGTTHNAGLTACVFAAAGVFCPLPPQVSWIKAHINTANVSSFCILLLVWLTFCNTFGNSTVRTVPGGDVAATVFLDVALFILFVVVCFVVAWPPPPLQALRNVLRLNKPDAVAVVICGSTKTVAMGVPLISVMYKQVPYAGLLALPLIVYHALQVLLGGLMLDPLKKWCLAAPPESKAARDAVSVVANSSAAAEQELPGRLTGSDQGSSSTTALKDIDKQYSKGGDAV